MQISLGLLRPVLIFSIFFSQAWAANFTFTFGGSNECDDFQVSWSGGSAPYQLTLIPVLGTPRTMSIPDSSFSNGKGTYQTQLIFPKGQQFVATMSDASGFGTGGTSDVLEVGAGNSNCNTTDPGVDFFFELNTALQQCRTFTFDNYAGAIQPVTITGVIPGGESFVLNPPVGPTSFDWIADVASGTGIIFILADSKGRKGGSSDIRTVSLSGDPSCLTSNSPTSISITPSPSASEASSTSGAPAPSNSSDGSNSKESHGPSGGVIAGAVAAGLFVLATIAIVVVFLRRRQRRNRYDHRRFGSLDLANEPPSGPLDHANLPVISPYPMSPTHTTSPSSHNLLPHDGQTHYSQSDVYPPTMVNPYSAYNPSVYGGTASHARSPSNAQSDGAASSSRAGGGEGTVMSWGNSSMSSAARRKAAAAGVPLEHTPTPARFILHTDLEDISPPPPVEDEIIELPPQYSERRAPIPALQSPEASSSGPGSSSGLPPGAAPPNAHSRLPSPIVPTIPGHSAPGWS